MTVTPRIVDGLILYGDQAYSAVEWAERNRKQAQKGKRRIYQAAYQREWRRRNPERWREIKDASRLRGRLLGSLHSVSCTGPIRATGCVCDKIRCYSRPSRPALRVAE